MSLAYSVLPHYCIVLTHGINNRDKKDILFIIISFFLLLTYGTRGPVLLASLYLILEVALGLFEKRRNRIIFITILSTLALFLVQKWEYVLIGLSKLFGNMSLSSRIFDRILDLSFFESKGRDEMLDVIISKLSSMPTFGYGIAGDRIFLGADAYVHNFYYEIICSYGYYLGYTIIGLIIALIVVALYKCRNTTYKYVFLPVLFAGFLKLFFSSTYLTEPFFYLLLGLLVNIFRNKKIKSHIV
jgi:hypothetical protein